MELACTAGPAMLFGAMYIGSSSTLLVLNKVAIHFFPFVGFVTAVQYMFSVMVVLTGRALDLLEAEPLQLDLLKKFIWVPLVFSLAVFTNGKMLEAANVETAIVVRTSTPLAVSILEWCFLNKELPSGRSCMALVGIMVGAIMYVLSDKEFKMEAYGWGLTYFVVIVFEMVYVKHVLTNVDMTTWGRVYYNNTFSLIITPLFMLGNNEFVGLLELEPNVKAISALLACCVGGILISFAGFKFRSLVDATTFTVVGVTCKIITVAINMLIWDKHASLTGIMWLFLAILGGVCYKPAPERKPCPCCHHEEHSGTKLATVIDFGESDSMEEFSPEAKPLVHSEEEESDMIPSK